MHYRGVKREGRGDVNLNYNQGETVKVGLPLEVMKGTDEKRGRSETSV